MTNKYTKKDFMENIKTLTSPFEEKKQETQGKEQIPGFANMIKQLASRNKGMKP